MSERIKHHELYGGRKIPFTDNKGNIYPEAFNIATYYPNTPNKTVTVFSYFYRSTESFDAGEYPIAEIDGGCRKYTFAAEEWDKLMAANQELVQLTTQTLFGILSNIKDSPKSDGTFESFHANAGEIITSETPEE